MKFHLFLAAAQGGLLTRYEKPVDFTLGGKWRPCLSLEPIAERDSTSQSFGCFSPLWPAKSHIPDNQQDVPAEAPHAQREGPSGLAIISGLSRTSRSSPRRHG